MPRDTSIKSVLVIGSGPIVIGQACEFDYSGTQACRVLKSEGIRVILLNSNPATIMTDPEFADATYIEPITTEVLEAMRKNKGQDQIVEELADILIRVCDLYGGLKRYGAVQDSLHETLERKANFNKTREKMHGVAG